MTYHQRLKSWLSICKVTQAALAKSCGVSDQSVYYWLSGERRPRAAHHDRIVAALGLTDAQFYGSFRGASSRSTHQ